MVRQSAAAWVAAALLLGACTGAPDGTPDVRARAPADQGSADDPGSPDLGSPAGRASSSDPGSPTVAPPTPATAPTPSPSPSWGDAAVVLRRDAGFAPDVLAAVEEVDGVAVVAGSRNGQVSLWASTAADGTPVDVFPDDFQVLLTARVDEDGLPGPRLAPGRALLTPVGAALRDGLDVGGTLLLGPDRTPVTVAGVATEQEPYGSSEVVLHPADADAARLEPLDRVFLLLDEDADADAVADDLRALLGTDDARAVEVRDLGPDGARRGRRTLPISSAKQLFGEFAFRDRPGTRDVDMDPDWVREHLVAEEVPLLGTVRCHRDVIEDLRAALDEVVAAGAGDWVDPSRSSGCWAPRRISEGGNLSKHAWGIAVDVNVDFALPGLGEVPPPAVVEAFRSNGFSWGGDFPRPDNHHWEWVGDA